LGLIDAGLGLPNSRLGLKNLFIQFRRFDYGKRIACVNTISNVYQAPLDVSIGAGEDRSFRNRLNITGQLQAAAVRRPADGDHRYSRQRPLTVLGFIDNEPVSMNQRKVSRKESNDQ
jgi:hypothetical protein